MKGFAGKILIIVQNLPVPLDRRVWLESRTLRDHGYKVSVICPTSKEHPEKYQLVENIAIYRYDIPFEAKGFLSYFAEFLYAWFATACLSLRVLRREGFDVIQACNPPDTYFLLGWLYKVFGKKFIFDHHDLSPEMFLAKFPHRRGVLYRLLILLEKLTMKTADVVLVTNESYRDIAISRGHKKRDDIYVVRTGPEFKQLAPVPAEPALKRGAEFLVCYLGEMCPQDGVDYLLRAAHYLRHQLGREDVRFVLIGGGPAVPDLQALNQRLKLTDKVEFTGRLPDADVSRYLSTADVCVDPDPYSEWADNSTMNKILEYMVFSKPIVAFDLKEIHNSARRAALYARPNDISQFAQKIDHLLEDAALRHRMGAYGHRRVVHELAWACTHTPLLAAYARLFNRSLQPPVEAEIDVKITRSLQQLQLADKNLQPSLM